jgi:hypothetical protein
MPYKQNTSSSETTSTRIDSQGQMKSSISRSMTTTRRKMTRGETAGGLLTTIGQIQMIAITIIVLAVGSVISDFDTDDLIQTTPNYNQTNTYIPIDDPLNNVDYQQYGTQVFGTFFGDTGLFNQFDEYGSIIQRLIEILKDPVKAFRDAFQLRDDYLDQITSPLAGSFIDTFGSTRFSTLSLYSSTTVGGFQSTYYIYTQMTESERIFVRDNQSSLQDVEDFLFNKYRPTQFYLFGFTNPLTSLYQWGWYKWPTITSIIDILGV